MWQRIQTLYLFLATALVASLFFCSRAEYIDGSGTLSFVSYVPYLVLTVVVALLDLLALTTWKFRVFQMRTAVLAAIISIAMQGWLVVDFIATRSVLNFHLTALFPVAAAILDFLAARSILADEMMVRSASRLRSADRRSRKK